MISVYLFAFSLSLMLGCFWISRRMNLCFGWKWRVVGAVAALLGLVLTITGGSELEKSFDKRSWVSTTGVVTSADVIGDRAKRPHIRYQYSHAGAEYEGVTDLDQPSFGGRNQRASTAKIKTSFFSPGDSVTVFVNPTDPETSTLRPHPFWGEYARAGIGVFLFALGGAAMLGRRNGAS